MKRIAAILLVLSFCFALCACADISNPGKLSTNFDDSKLTYNGRTYISYRHYPFEKNKYLVDWKSEDRVEIARIPYGLFYILGAVEIYTGNNTENPDYITRSQSAYKLYVREDIILNDDSKLCVSETDEPIYFSISDVTTGNVIAEELEDQYDFEELCDFYASCVDCPDLRLSITIYELDGKIYLQDAFDSDYYEVTKEFEEDLDLILGTKHLI